MQRTFILLYLTVQLLVPASYYATGREFDERFAWRMFSPTRVTPCTVGFTAERAGARVPVRPLDEVHQAWVELAHRARPGVVEAVGQAECARMTERGERPAVYVDLRCELPDGRAHRPIDPERNLCEPR